jgi:hypothetical protein
MVQPLALSDPAEEPIQVFNVVVDLAAKHFYF